MTEEKMAEENIRSFEVTTGGLCWEDIMEVRNFNVADILEVPISTPNIHVFSSQMDLSCIEFLDIFWSDSPSSQEFWKTFHISRGDSDVKLSSWKKSHVKSDSVSADSSGFGMRCLSFIHPLNSKQGLPSITQCSQEQNVHLSRSPEGGVHAEITTQQTMTDIPYADAFSVKMLWHILDKPQSSLGTSESARQQDITQCSCHVSVYVSVPFTREVPWLQDEVEKGAVKEIKQAYQEWNALAKEKIASLRSELLNQSQSGNADKPNVCAEDNPASNLVSTDETKGESFSPCAPVPSFERTAWEKILKVGILKVKTFVHKGEKGAIHNCN